MPNQSPPETEPFKANPVDYAKPAPIGQPQDGNPGSAPNQQYKSA